MTPDYFAALDLPRDFAIQLPELEKRYFASQRLFHPDRLVGKDAAERQRAVAQSMLINEAYEALKEPLKRAQHLLALAGENSSKPSQALLMEIMELREALAEAASLEEISKLAGKNEKAKREAIDTLLQAFAGSDIPKAAELTMRLSYLTKLEDEIRIRKKAIL